MVVWFDSLLLVTRLGLSGVFAVAGLAKLLDIPGSQRALVGFGLPKWLAVPLGSVLPVVELSISLTLIPAAIARWGALAALGLLLLFVLAIAINLAIGRRPDCHCFGQLHSSKTGPGTLFRNVLLAAAAGLVAWRTPPPVPAQAWESGLSPSLLVALVLAVAVFVLLAGMGWFSLHLFRQQGRLLLRLESLEKQLAALGAIGAAGIPAAGRGLPVGSPAPGFHGAGTNGRTISLDHLRSPGKPVLLVFTDPECDACNDLLPELTRWRGEYPGRFNLALLSRGNPKANEELAFHFEPDEVILQPDDALARAYQVIGTPTAVLVRPDGSVGAALAEGAEAIRELVAQTVGDPVLAKPVPEAPCNCGKSNGRAATAPRAALRAGERAPHLQLPDLAGETISLADFRGSPTLVLFWNPSCGFCERMLEDLRAWESGSRSGTVKLLVVSTGTPEANRALGLRSPVVLDSGFQAGNAFGASGTPSAVLVDAEGRIASHLAVGSEAILALARSGLPELTQ
jgi:peroxiredoxin